MRDQTIHISQGDYAISGEHEKRISTVLGSCVAACIWDPVRAIGGMNHFLLPDSADALVPTASAGTHAMELLINGLVRRGADRGGLRVRLYGGASMLKGLSDIGSRNAEFARRFVDREGLSFEGGCLGGNRARRVQFWPVTGEVKHLLLGEAEDVALKPTATQAGSDVELF